MTKQYHIPSKPRTGGSVSQRPGCEWNGLFSEMGMLGLNVEFSANQIANETYVDLSADNIRESRE